MAWGFIILGCLLGLTIILIPIAIVIVPVGMWGVSRSKSNTRAVEEAYAQFLGRPATA